MEAPKPPHRRASDRHWIRNKVFQILCAFALWWLGSLYSDYRGQVAVVSLQAQQIAAMQQQLAAMKDAVQHNAAIGAEDRKELLRRMERMEDDLKAMRVELRGWFVKAGR